MQKNTWCVIQFILNASIGKTNLCCKSQPWLSVGVVSGFTGERQEETLLLK